MALGATPAAVTEASAAQGCADACPRDYVSSHMADGYPQHIQHAMESKAEGFAKLAELLSNKRISANVVLGFVLFAGAGIPLAQRGDWLGEFLRTVGNSAIGGAL